jgi:hypothetical protein
MGGRAKTFKTGKGRKTAKKTPRRVAKTATSRPAVTDAVGTIDVRFQDEAEQDEQLSGLSLREWRFVEAYLGEAGGNATEAARMAGCGTTYWSQADAGSTLLEKPQVVSTIARMIDQSRMSTEMTIHRLGQMLRANIADYWAYKPDGSVDCDAFGRPRFDLERARQLGKLHLIDKITYTNTGIKIELPKKTEVIALMMKFQGLLTERLEITHREDPQQVKAEIMAKLRAVAEKLDEKDRAILNGLPSPTPQPIADGPLPSPGWPASGSPEWEEMRAKVKSASGPKAEGEGDEIEV